MIRPALAALLICGMAFSGPARAQGLDLSQGGPISITATDGIEWRQQEQQVIARGNARAVRETVTVTADRLIAWYRKKAPAAGAAPAAAAAKPAQAGLAAESEAGNEVYRLVAEGNVRIFTATDQATGDKATYDVDEAVLVLTGRDLKLITPNDVLTARDTLEYWAQKRMAVARGDAVVVTSDSKRLAADTLVAYTSDAPAQPAPAPAPAKPGEARPADPAASGKLEKVEAYGNVSVRTVTDMVTGDRAVYVPDTGIARVGGNVRITRGQNQLNGALADVNMKTGIARLTAAGAERVQGLVVPNDASSQSLDKDPIPPPPAAGGRGR